MIVTIGTNDTLASPGAQLDYYQSVIDKMGRATVDGFARFFVMPQAGHGLERQQLRRGRRGQDDRAAWRFPIVTISSRCSSTGSRRAWRPAMSVTVTAGEKSLPLCSYPTYPRYQTGSPTDVSSSLLAAVTRFLCAAAS